MNKDRGDLRRSGPNSMKTVTKTLLTLLLIVACVGRAAGQNGSPPIYVVLWFDTEDYILAAG